MLRSFCFALLGLGLLAGPASAQTASAKAKASAATSKTTVRRTNRLNDATESEKNQSGYAAPGEPIQDPRYNGKNTPPYNGAAPAKKGTTLTTPK